MVAMRLLLLASVVARSITIRPKLAMTAPNRRPPLPDLIL
jgi:hypothetical protein